MIGCIITGPAVPGKDKESHMRTHTNFRHISAPGLSPLPIPPGVLELIGRDTIAEYSELERLRLINCIELARERHALQRLANSQRREHRHGDAATLCRQADKMATLAREYAAASGRKSKVA